MYKLITFDVYSALVDVHLSLTRAFRRVVADDQLAQQMGQMWRKQQWDYVLVRNSLHKHASYAYITRCALEYTLQAFQVTLSEAEKEQCMQEWTQLTLWPEAFDVLSEIKRRGYQIALLSNGDEKMLRELQPHFGIAFDDIFASSQAEAYKPDPRIYQLPFDRWNLQRDEVLHVAGSAIDMMGATACGVTCAWTNRFRVLPLDASFRPAYEYANLEGLLELLQ